MIECSLCSSPSKPNYIFTECSHLVCSDCVIYHRDTQYSLRCCNRVTYLSEQTVQALNSQPPFPVSQKQNKKNAEVNCQSQLSIARSPPKQLQLSYCQQLRLEQSILKTKETQMNPLSLQLQQQATNCLPQLEKILNQEITKVKYSYECYRKEIEKKQQMVLTDLYNTYSQHLSSIPSVPSNAHISTLKEKLQSVANPGPQRLPSDRSTPDSGQDKILEKLDYNQQKMREKLHKHYELLK